MELSHLRTYVALAKKRSFVAAAGALGVSQPAVSRQLQSLERELGVRLVERSRGDLTLTPAGEKLLAFAQATLEGYDDLVRRLSSARRELSGQLRLAASTIPGEHLLPAIIPGFVQRHPHVSIHLSIADTAAAMECVSARQCHLAVVGFPERRPGITLKRFYEDEVVCIAPKDHPLAGGEPAELASVLDYPLILREHGSGTMSTVEARLAADGQGLPARNVRLVLGSSNAVIAAVAAGLGLGFVSTMAVSGDARTEGVSVLRLAGPRLLRHLYLAYEDSEVARESVAQAFLDYVEEWAGCRLECRAE